MSRYPHHPYRPRRRDPERPRALVLRDPFPCAIPVTQFDDGRIWEDDLFEGKLTPERRQAMAEAIVAALRDRPHGLDWQQLTSEVAQRVPRDLFAKARAILWAARATQLALEAAWVVERVPGSHPRRWRLSARRRGRFPAPEPKWLDWLETGD